jgi:hypothetical protein
VTNIRLLPVPPAARLSHGRRSLARLGASWRQRSVGLSLSPSMTPSAGLICGGFPSHAGSAHDGRQGDGLFFSQRTPLPPSSWGWMTTSQAIERYGEGVGERSA